MTLYRAVGSFNIGTGVAGSTVKVVVSDPDAGSFQPKVVLFWWSGKTNAVDAAAREPIRPGRGWAISTTERFCCAVGSANNGSISDTARTMRDDSCIAITSPGGSSLQGAADWQSTDADGFTLVIDTQFVVNVRVHYLALGGSDLTDVKAAEVTVGATTGDEDVTSVGFQPDCVLFMSSHQTPNSTLTEMFLMLGAAAGPTPANAVLELRSADNVSPSNTSSYCRSGDECIAMIDFTPSSIGRRGKVTSWLANGFRLNWAETTGITNVFYLALKGGKYRLGNLLTRTDTADIVASGFGFSPKAGFLVSACRSEDAADTPGDHVEASIGAFASATDRAAHYVRDEDALATTYCAAAVEHDAVYINGDLQTGGVSALMDVKSVDADGFTCIMDDADTAPAFVWYLAVGPLAAAEELALSENVGSSDSVEISVLKVFLRLLSESTTSSDSVRIEALKVFGKILDESVAVSDAFLTEALKIFTRMFSEASTVTDNIFVEKLEGVFSSSVPATSIRLDTKVTIDGGVSTLSAIDLQSVRTSYAANQVPTAEFVISNKNGKYTSASSILDEGKDIILSASIDGGTTYARFFSGSITKRTSELSPTGEETLRLACRDERLTRKYVVGNNAVQRSVDIGQVFSGSGTASDGTTIGWVTDSNGNFPNGLLYQSGLTLSISTPDIYTGTADVPLIVMQRESIYDSINRVSNVYGLSWFINPLDNVITVLKESDDYPTLSGGAVTLGTDINRSTMQFDNLNSASGVLIAGRESIFWFEGSTNSYTQIVDSEITTWDEAKERAAEWLRLNSTSVRRGSITVPAYTASTLGKRITINDAKHGWTGMGNIKSVEHRIQPDRWTTALGVDNIPRTEEKLFATVLDEIAQLKKKKDYSTVFKAFDLISASDVRVTKSASPTGQIAAIGVGTNAVGGLGPGNLIDILPLNARVTSSDGAYTVSYANWGRNFPENYTFASSNARIREVMFFRSSDTDTDNVLVSKSYTLSRPTAQWSDASFSIPLQTYILGIRNAIADGPTYMPKDGQSDLRFNTFTNSMPSSYPQHGEPHVTESQWFDSTAVTLSSADRQDVSWDTYNKTVGLWQTSGTLPSNHKSFAVRWSIKTGLDKIGVQEVDKLLVTIVGRTSYRGSGTAGPSGSMRLELFDSGIAGERFNEGSPEFGFSGEIGAYEWFTISSEISSSDHALGRFISDDGQMTMRLHPHGNGYRALSDSSNYSVSVAYWDVGVVRGTISTIVERGDFRNPEFLNVSRPIGTLIGIFSTSDGTGDDLLGRQYVKMAGERTADVRPSPYGNYPIIEIYYPDKWVDIGPWHPEVRDTSVMAPSPSNWRRRLDVLREAFNNPTLSLYVKYIPQNEALGQEEFAHGSGWILKRSTVGLTDSFQWRMDTATDLRSRQNHPAYGMPYTIYYTAIRSESGGDPLYARISDSVGWDKTTDKTWVFAFKE